MEIISLTFNMDRIIYRIYVTVYKYGTDGINFKYKVIKRIFTLNN